MSFSCRSNKGFEQITNIESQYASRENIPLEVDTLDLKFLRLWSYGADTSKQEFANKIKKINEYQIKNIEADTSKVTKVLLTGSEKHIIFKAKKRIGLTNLTTKYEDIDILHESNDSIYNKIELVTLPRNSGITNVKIFFPAKEKYAAIDLDTKYSLIHIYTCAIKPISKKIDNSPKEEITRDTMFTAPKIIEIITKEGIYVYHEIPFRKKIIDSN